MTSMRRNNAAGTNSSDSKASSGSIRTAGFPHCRPANRTAVTSPQATAAVPAWDRIVAALAHNLAFAILSPQSDRLAAASLDQGFTHAVVLFAGLRQGSRNLHAVDPVSRLEKKLSSFRSLRTFVRYPAWSPSQDWIVCEQTETTGNLYRLELTSR